MNSYVNAFIRSFNGTLDWTWKSIIFEVPFYTNYFWGLILISLFVWVLEMVFPWRKEQAIFRKDFWLDGFYMFFNFFIFSIVIGGFYKMLQIAFTDIGITDKSLAVFQSFRLANGTAISYLFCGIRFCTMVYTYFITQIPCSSGNFIKYTTV